MFNLKEKLPSEAEWNLLNRDDRIELILNILRPYVRGEALIYTLFEKAYKIYKEDDICYEISYEVITSTFNMVERLEKLKIYE